MEETEKILKLNEDEMKAQKDRQAQNEENQDLCQESVQTNLGKIEWSLKETEAT